MQTFLPYPDFRRSAEVLDPARLGKQRVETLQILRALELFDYGWASHPAVTMWRGHTPALVAYGLAFVDVWTGEGRADSTAPMIAEFAPDVVGRTQAELAAEGLMPAWLGDDRLHRSHRSALLRKAPDFYGAVFDDVDDELPYFWPDPPAAGAHELDEPTRTVWIVRATSDDQYTEFRRRRIVGLGTESGIDVDASGRTETELRELLKECTPGRRPGKDLRVLASFVSDLAIGDEVAVLHPTSTDPTLMLGVVDGDYRFSARGATLSPHRRHVRWSGTLTRSEVIPPALLQNPRTLFPASVTP